MTVGEIMKTDAATCLPSDNLARAAKIMHERRCGFLAVITADGAVAGVLTDRDVCLHAADKSQSLGHLAVRDTMSHRVFSCLPEDDVKAAIEIMAAHHVHRLPVIDNGGHLRGVLSIDHVIETPRRRGAPSAEQILAALKDINAPRGIDTAVA